MVIGGKNMKYKQGEKMIVEITEVKENSYVLNRIGEVEPMEAKIRRQAAEITRLLTENKKLKETKTEDIEHWCDVCTKQSVIEQARAEGAETAWELAKKIILNNGYSVRDLYEIFDSNDSYYALENYNYQEATAKVAEWEKAKEEIKVGDEVEKNDLRDVRFIVTFTNGRLMNGVTQDGFVFANEKPKEWHKTGSHIDIDSFLKQIGGKE